MPRRSTALTRYLRETGMKVSRNVQDLFGTTEAAVVTQPDPTPNHEGVANTVGQTTDVGRRAGRSDQRPGRGRRGRD
jgi:hypothetical protein